LSILECEQKVKKHLAALMDIETEKLKKAQAGLETERQKVSVAVAVLDIATTADRLCGETLIDPQLINTARFYLRFFKLYKSPLFGPVLSHFDPFLASIACSFKIHFNIILAYMTAT
jgi:hypothetical protein